MSSFGRPFLTLPIVQRFAKTSFIRDLPGLDDRPNPIYLVFGDREEVKDLGVVVDSFIKATMVSLHNVVHKLFNGLLLTFQL